MAMTTCRSPHFPSFPISQCKVKTSPCLSMLRKKTCFSSQVHVGYVQNPVVILLYWQVARDSDHDSTISSIFIQKVQHHPKPTGSRLSTWIKAFQMSLDSNSAGSLKSPWPSLLDPLHACPHHGTSVFGRSSHILVLALAISTSLWTLVCLFILCIDIHNSY